MKQMNIPATDTTYKARRNKGESTTQNFFTIHSFIDSLFSSQLKAKEHEIMGFCNLERA